jgi:hypothetical protein
MLFLRWQCSAPESLESPLGDMSAIKISGPVYTVRVTVPILRRVSVSFRQHSPQSPR